MSELVEQRFPELAGRGVRHIVGGWDFDVFDVDGEWIVRIANRPEVERWLAKEIALLPELAVALPVPIPRPELVAPDAIAYRKLPGRPLAAADIEIAHQLGRFLTALHSFPVERALTLGVEDVSGEATRVHYRDLRWSEFRARVLPLLARHERAAADRRAEAFFEDDANFRFRPALIHWDLGPEHILCDNGRITGVLDWADAAIGDPALDFAWIVHGLGETFASNVVDAYEADDDPMIRERARFYHLLGPFYEVVYGLDNDKPELVDSGLAGVRARL